MRRLLLLITIVAFSAATSCRVGKGCPANGRNIGAERLVSGDPQAIKEAKKAGKFRH